MTRNMLFKLNIGVALLLMTTSGLLAVIASFLFEVRPGKLQIMLGYAAYLIPALIFLFVDRSRQLYVSKIDLIALPFFLLVFAGLVLRVLVEEQPEAVRNIFYFALFMGLPYLVGRVFDISAISQYESLLLPLLVMILVLMSLPGAVEISDSMVRPILFSTEYTTISMSFALGLGVIVGVWKGCVAENKWKTLLYALLVAAFISVSSFIVLRGSYYLTALCAFGLLFALRKRNGAFTVLVAIVIGLFVGGFASVGSFSYHEKLLHPNVQQLPFNAIYLDFFSTNAWNIQPGRSVLQNVNCLPMVESNDSAMIRVLLYLEAIKLFLSSPIFGVGVSNFSQYSCFTPHGFPHSTILHVAAEMGLLGLALFSLMLIKSFLGIGRAIRDTNLPTWILFAFIYFFCLDQIYGSYFFSGIMYFMVGLASRHVANLGLQEIR